MRRFSGGDSLTLPHLPCLQGQSLPVTSDEATVLTSVLTALLYGRNAKHQAKFTTMPVAAMLRYKWERPLHYAVGSAGRTVIQDGGFRGVCCLCHWSVAAAHLILHRGDALQRTPRPTVVFQQQVRLSWFS